MAVRCGNRVHQTTKVGQHAHHETVAQVKVCQMVRPLATIEETQIADLQEALEDLDFRSAADAEEAYERWLERPVVGEELGADGLTDHEREMGCIDYEEAMRAAEDRYQEDRVRI